MVNWYDYDSSKFPRQVITNKTSLYHCINSLLDRKAFAVYKGGQNFTLSRTKLTQNKTHFTKKWLKSEIKLPN